MVGKSTKRLSKHGVMSFYQSKHPDLSIKDNAQMSHARRRSQERHGRIVDVKAIAKAIRVVTILPKEE